MPERIGVYPGTFDPVTNGHLDIIGRAAALFDRLIIAVAASDAKGPIFSLPERLELVAAEAALLPTPTPIEVRPLTGLLVTFAQACGAVAVVRGLRGATDFDYEFQMAGMNNRMAPEVQTLFLMASDGHAFITATLVRQIAQMGGDVTAFVPSLSLARLRQRMDRT